MDSATFLRAAEVWTPSADGSLLEFAAGAFGPARRFAALSATMCFGRGEGLPGRAWEEGRPQLLDGFTDSHFRRRAAAEAAGFDCAVALPLTAGGTLRAVLVLYAAHGAQAASALELWHRDARVTTDLTLVAGAYGDNAASFESVSHDTTLPRGVGLPGLALQRGEAVFVADIAAAGERFVRGEAAVAAGLRRGLALPVGGDADGHVVTLLADAALPLARRIERWAPDGERLRRVEAFSELHDAHAGATAWLPLAPAAGSIARAFTTGVPALNGLARDEPGAPAAAAAGCGATLLAALPVVWEDAVVEVLALYL